MESNKQEHIKQLSQGAYGCLFLIKNPNKTQEKQPDQFVTKIQKKKSVSNNETLVGKKIMKILHYEDYFAPVLKSEKVKLGSIDEEEIDKCNFLKEDKKAGELGSYESSEILYVGKFSLADYLTQLPPPQFMEIFVTDHVVLLEGLQKLIDAGIIHFDLRENNIMIRDSDSRPIIIDFGLSIDTKETVEPKAAFYIYYNEYAPWCIEIVIESYISNEIDDERRNQNATISEITKLIDEYFEKNMGMKELLLPEERTLLRQKLIDFFSTYDNKPWQTIYTELLKFRNSWDNYGMAIIYLFLFENLELTKYESEFAFLKEYKQLLKTIVLSSPSERMLPKDTISEINKIFGTIQRTMNKQLKTSLTIDLRNPEIMKTKQQSVAKVRLEEQKIEQSVYE
uniref:Protein kinase domain-containing protein n=1 Tax=viral metagenome TaxID=1070528 RepID=A0A6C0JMR6_9ZZZZ